MAVNTNEPTHQDALHRLIDADRKAQQRVAEAGKEEQRILDDARKEAQNLKDKADKEASEEADRIIEDARSRKELKRKQYAGGGAAGMPEDIKGLRHRVEQNTNAAVDRLVQWVIGSEYGE